jgi:ribosomal 30S subunit maturation factor RimM
VVEGEGGDLLVPALRQVVAAVDLPGGRIVIKEIPGLLDDPMES